MGTGFRALAAIATLLIGASASAQEMSGFVSLEEFRRAHPAPQDLDRVRDAFDGANLRLQELAKDGAAADVSLVYPDATISYGRDEFFSGDPVRFHEMRQRYESIAVGDSACTRMPEQPWECTHADTWVGLRPVRWEAVTTWTDQQIPCPGGPCQGFVVRQADVMQDGDTVLVSDQPDRDYYEFAVFLDQSGMPVMTSEGRYQDGVLVEPLASFVYRLDARIDPIRLPDVTRRPASGSPAQPASPWAAPAPTQRPIP